MSILKTEDEYKEFFFYSKDVMDIFKRSAVPVTDKK